MKNKVKPIIDTKAIEELFKGDLDLILFFATWLKNGMNAKAAYLELHPDVGEQSARTLGSRMLTKVDPAVIAQAYGLGPEMYFDQLKEGLGAMKSDITGQKYPDHKTRDSYHTKLGKLLGIIRDDNQTNIQINLKPILGEDWKAE